MGSPGPNAGPPLRLPGDGNAIASAQSDVNRDPASECLRQTLVASDGPYPKMTFQRRPARTPPRKPPTRAPRQPR